MMADFARAQGDGRGARALDADQPRACNNLAWLLAHCRPAELRQPGEAVALARKACELTGWQDAACLDTYAAALVASGQGEEAVRWQEQAVEKAPAGQKADYRTRLELYQAGQGGEPPPGDGGGIPKGLHGQCDTDS